MAGSWRTYTDPQSGRQFPVWEGHYDYPGSSLAFIPTFAGGMFEGLMPDEVVPETTWGRRSFGLADARTVAVQIKYATGQLHYPVWGMSPSSTPDAAPQQAYANIQALRARYPGGYGADGFFDAVNPVTGAVGHRDLVLDQSMIMAALDNALENRAIQRDFARDPVSWAAHAYLSIESMSLR